MSWLRTDTDFYIAPASSTHHLARKGGLVEHSLNVFNALEGNASRLGLIPDVLPYSSLVVAGLGHDLCKANYYVVEMRNRKNEHGQWEQYPFYAVKEEFPCGHGEKSVILLSRFIALTNEEILAIRWHMGSWTPTDYALSFSMGDAMRRSPLVPLLHMADLEATFIKETNQEGINQR